MKTIDIIKNSILHSKYRNAFTLYDLRDIANYETLKRTIARLEKQGFIKRVIRGVYYKPTYYKDIDMWSQANVDDIVKAIARQRQYMICVSGESVLNNLHLSTQISNIYEYAWTGPSCKIKINNFVVVIKKNKPKDFCYDALTNMVVQSLKMIGKDELNQDHINTIKTLLSEKQKEQILNSAPKTSLWIREAILNICGKGKSNVSNN